MHGAVARSTLRSQNVKSTSAPERSCKLRCSQSAGHFEVNRLEILWARSTFGSRDVEKVPATVARSTCRTQNASAGVGRLKKICRDALRLAGTVQEISPSDMLAGQGADFLRGVAFWSISSSGLLR